MTLDRASLESQLRNYLRRLARGRVAGVVTADDVHTFVGKNGLKLNLNEQISLTRTVLAEPDFTFYEYIPSRRETAKGRMIAAWFPQMGSNVYATR